MAQKQARINQEADDATGRSVEAIIAFKVSKLRTAQRMTLEKLAAMAGLSKGYLSKIENGRQTPPIATLARIASALNTDVSYFLQEDSLDQTERVSVVRVAERRSIKRGGSQFGYDYKSLAHKRRFKRMEPFVFSFPSKTGSKKRFEHDGEEFLYVLSGQIEFEVGEDKDSRTWVLEPGDCVYFDSSLPHRGKSLKADSTALVVVLNPEG
ncbi:MAG: helix-turn-helix domain-containing protein [Burkholderiaceae bacterium]